MSRIKFRKGEQRKFLQKVLDNIRAPFLVELINRGVGVNYSTLKNYFSESRLLPEDLFLELCELANISKDDLNFEMIEENWGRIKGGRIGRRKGL